MYRMRQVRREYFSGKKDLKFVERSRIHDVIINEGIRYATVNYYLAVMVRGIYGLGCLK